MRTLIAGIALATVLTTGGAVARQAFQLQAAPIYPWRCPACDTGNAGNPNDLFHATCRSCRVRYEWWDVLQPLTGGRARPSVEAGR